ncbi:MAG: DUF7544 domain-containing protein, partial [Candidatus Dormibacteraceae bacterium]
TILYFLLSCVTTGALIRGSAEQDANQVFGFKQAWRAGRGTFASILGLRLLSFLWVVIVGGLIGGGIALSFLTFSITGHLIIGAIVVTLTALLALVLLIFSVILAIIFLLAARAIVLEQLGPIRGLRRGFHIFGRQTGHVLLAWLIQAVLSLAVGIVATVVLLIVWIPLLLTLLFAHHSFSSSDIIGAALIAGIPTILIAIVLKVLSGTYFSTYWTITYRRLVFKPAPAAE